jgi:hypothetical protein
MAKIARWAEDIKTKFNEETSKVILMTRKHKEQNVVIVYINNKATHRYKN